MNRVHFPNWSNEYEKASNAVYEVSKQLKEAIKLVELDQLDSGSYYCDILSNNIYDVLDYWTGSTYVGRKKNKLIQDAFQSFFINLYSFLMTCKSSKSKQLIQYRKLAYKALYHGVVYRYIGHGDAEDELKTKVEPVYNDIYVSWSKKAGNSYLLSKLYGTKTLLTCEITEDNYGIDLEAFGVSKCDEAEVVFPTIKNLIKDVKYIEEYDCFE